MFIRLWRDAAWRAILFQLILIVAVVALGGWIVNNTLTNLEHRGISTGFDFLDQAAGFGINQTLVEYDESHSYGRTFLVGLLNTLLVSALGVILATVLGFSIGIARLSSNWLLAKIATVYIEVFRNIPLLLQIFFWYFAVLRILPSPRESFSFLDAFFLNVRGIYMPMPAFETGAGAVVSGLLIAVAAVIALKLISRRQQIKTGRVLPYFAPIAVFLLVACPAFAWMISDVQFHWDLPALKGFNFKGGLEIIPELAALWFALSIYTAAFIAEVVRSGIESVSKGQKEAAAALGLKPAKVLNLVVIPQAMRVIIPPLTNQYLNLIKNSSLATAIGYPDLVNVFAGTTQNQTGQAIEVIAMTMAVYLTISLVVSVIMNLYNRWMALVER